MNKFEGMDYEDYFDKKIEGEIEKIVLDKSMDLEQRK